jgi:hypothetical protein
VNPEKAGLLRRFLPLSQPWERGLGGEGLRLGAAPTVNPENSGLLRCALLPLSQPWERGVGVRACGCEPQRQRALLPPLPVLG